VWELARRSECQAVEREGRRGGKGAF